MADDERLVRLVFYPDHCDENDCLRPEGIGREDLIDRGFSIYRKTLARDSVAQMRRIERNIAEWLRRHPTGEFRGCAQIVAQTARDIRDHEGHQAFVVLDAAAEPDDLAHAHIKFARHYGRAMQRKLRYQLCEAFDAVLRKDATWRS